MEGEESRVSMAERRSFGGYDGRSATKTPVNKPAGGDGADGIVSDAISKAPVAEEKAFHKTCAFASP